jgi:methionyl-tRNA synthetase
MIQRNKDNDMADETPATTPGAPPAAPELVSIADFKRLDLRVARVLEARPHPNADKLILLRVEVGDQQKQIIAGIRQWYAPETLVGRLIIVVNNLQPAMLRGEESNGMLLAATSGGQVIFLTPERDCLPGSKIS